MDYKNKKRKEDNEFQNLKKRAEEVSRANRLKSLDEFTRFYNAKSPETSMRSIDKLSESSENEENFKNDENFVEQNISFIDDRNSDEAFDYNDKLEGVNNADSESEENYNGRVHEIGKYSDENPEDIKNNAAVVIQKWFRKSLIRKFLSRKSKFSSETQESFQYKPQKKLLKIEKQQGLFLKQKLLKKKLDLVHSKNQNFLILAQPKPKLQIQPQKAKMLITPIKRKISLKISSESIENIKSKENLKNEILSLKSQLHSQISWNYAQLSIIEELRSQELSKISDEKKILFINKKYNSLIYLLKQELNSLDISDNQSLEENILFEKEKQDKKETLYKLIQDSFEESLNSDEKPLKSSKTPENYFEEPSKPLENPSKSMSLNLGLISIENNDVGIQQSSDMSSDDRVDRIGITHSKSLLQLHGETTGKYTNSSSKDNKFPSFFEIEDSIDVQSIELISENLSENEKKNLPALPNLPMLHLDFMQHDAIYSEPRILTSAEFVIEYIKNVLSTLDLNQIKIELSRPLRKNIEEELIKIQEKVVGTPSETKIYDFPFVFDVERVLAVDSDDNDLETTMRQINAADKIHKKMLLNVLNCVFQQFRPYGFNGEPLP